MILSYCPNSITASLPNCVFDYLTFNHTHLERAILDHLAGTTMLSPTTTWHRCCNESWESSQTSGSFSIAGKELSLKRFLLKLLCLPEHSSFPCLSNLLLHCSHYGQAVPLSPALLKSSQETFLLKAPDEVTLPSWSITALSLSP